MTVIELLFVVFYIILCNAKIRITCSTKPTPHPTPSPTDATQHPSIPQPLDTCVYPTDPNLGPCINQALPYDIIILNDISCPITSDQCNSQQKMIAETVLSLKTNSTSFTSEIDNIPNDRIAYIEFDHIQTYTIISLLNKQYNQNPINNSDLNSFYCKITNKPSACNVTQHIRLGNPNLEMALNTAWNEFNTANSFQLNRLQKIIIFSNCKVPEMDIPLICANVESYINSSHNTLDILMVNNGQHFADNTPYIMCLVEHNTNRIFTNAEFDFFNWNNPYALSNITEIGIRFKLQNETCSPPTISPTNDPTRDPTSDPTTDPTYIPTFQPTQYPSYTPTNEPTKSPTTTPTINPTKYPTNIPTDSPIMCDCRTGREMDLIFLINTGCIMDIECDNVMESMAELESAIKGIWSVPRVAIITFDGNGIYEKINLQNNKYNSLSDTQRTIPSDGLNFNAGAKELYDVFRNISCNGNNNNPIDQSTNTIAAIQTAFDMFKYEEKFYLPTLPVVQTGRDKKIALISACKNSYNNAQDVCNAYDESIERIINTERGDREVEFTVINLGTKNGNMDVPTAKGGTYYTSHSCDITAGDIRRGYTIGVTGTYFQEAPMHDIIDIKNEICQEPTPAPTTDPTKWPTRKPTKRPTEKPTIKPTKWPTKRPTERPTKKPTKRPTKKATKWPTKTPTKYPTDDPTDYPTDYPTINPSESITPTKRLTTKAPWTKPYKSKETQTFENRRRLLQSEDGNAPCITLEITLETENIVPLNIEPDPASNIAVIGSAVGYDTDGSVNIPPPDDENLIWELDDKCVIDNERKEYYWPNEDWTSGELNISIEEINDNTSFIGTILLTTPNSIVYVYEFEEIPLYIHYVCFSAQSIDIIGGIYINDELINGTSVNKTVYFNVATLIFDFKNTITLLPNKTYEIKFELVGTYPVGCNLDSLNIYMNNNSSRRRLLTDPDNSATGQATVSSCAAGNELAQSPSMKAAVSAMCNNNLLNRDNIEEGLFRQYNSDAAVRNHLVKIGSITLYDSTNGQQTFNTTNFPQYDVQDPCITIDEENGIIYAIGGRLENGEAVDYIQAYELNVADLTQEGTIISNYETWKLDKPRYGSSCVYWNIDSNGYLVVIGGMSHSDLETRKVPNGNEDWYNDIRIFMLPRCRGNRCVMYDPEPSEIDIGLRKTLIGMKPMISTATLYLFGGRTTQMSQNNVQRIDLDAAYTGSATFVAEPELIEYKALPMVDDTVYDGQLCKMIMGGQSYKNYSRDTSEDGLNFNLLQLRLNGGSDIKTISDTRRRLQSLNKNNVLTEYDRQRLKVVEAYDRRRLQEERTQIYVRNYTYGKDGIWYNFSIPIEICYDNNQQLKNGVEYYENIIESKPNGYKWMNYKQNISEQILNKSLDVYSSWSNGFGAVNVNDMSIINIVYKQHTPKKLYKAPNDTHPERRKARYWWTNLNKKNKKDDWIDEKFHFLDCDDSESKD